MSRGVQKFLLTPLPGIRQPFMVIIIVLVMVARVGDGGSAVLWFVEVILHSLGWQGDKETRTWQEEELYTPAGLPPSKSYPDLAT